MIRSLRHHVVVAGFALAASQALGGNIYFNPSHAVVDVGDAVKMDVSLESPGFTGFYLLIGSDDAPFTFYVDIWTFPCKFGPCPLPGIYTYEVELVSLFLPGYDHELVGSLLVETQNLAPGTYTIHAQGEALNSANEPDPLSGSATITVIPEPATLSLLAVGLGAVVMRRRPGK